MVQGCVAKLVTCLTADPGVVSLILVPSHTIGEIDHEIIYTAILIPSPSRRVVSYKGKYMHEVLVNRLVKLVQEKGVARLTGTLSIKPNKT